MKDHDQKHGQQFGTIKKVSVCKVISGAEHASPHIIEGIAKHIKAMKDRVGEKYSPWVYVLLCVCDVGHIFMYCM